ncbi:response regulator transcription factor [Litoribacter ruber]|uniref:response regulator transcription factor n=1 Tax=Litoribacter ruber TaxID=702568 RepID=UPI001BDB49D1|nr:response regulator transcription factor [Litoribacter ruber]MBT0809805.1 response regulator transcription factor [Litoribacter ruber]
MTASIAIVDDHELFLLGIAQLIESSMDVSIVSTMKGGTEVKHFLDEGKLPDLLIMDFHMPDGGGAKLLSFLDRGYPELKKLVISMDTDARTIKLCQQLGADGFISKDAVFTDLKEAITSILEGETYFMMDNDNMDELEVVLAEKYKLTKREMQILDLILNEYLTSEIADKLCTSPLTIKTHRRNIFRKLDVRNLAGLVSLMRSIK